MTANRDFPGPSSWPFVPPDFEVPDAFETPDYRLRTLTVHDVVKDYDAVMSSADHIQREVWPGSEWPSGLTLEQNLIELGWHQREFQKRLSFAYTVVELDESRVIGCVYVNPTRRAGHDAEVHLWTRPPSQVTVVDEARLTVAVRDWLAAVWPFRRPAFPGVDPGWAEWLALPELPR